MGREWGGDLGRWLIYKSCTAGEWCVFPPDHLPDDARWFPTFEAARAAFAAGHK